MKTVKSERTESHVERVRFGYWNLEAEEFIPLDTMDVKALTAGAEGLRCSEELLEAVELSFQNLVGAVHEDLVDIWKRLDEMERSGGPSMRMVRHRSRSNRLGGVFRP